MTSTPLLKPQRISGKFRHYLVLTGILLLGLGLRFWNLDFKPLWIDEIVTALFSVGDGYERIPLETVFPLSQVPPLFTLNPEVSWGEISHHVITQSTHPPLFFCLLHAWLKLLIPFPYSLVWKLRAFSALLGTVAIAALYLLNRIAFSPAAGLMGAGVMAVSPFGVYLSQEARHYTLPILCISLSLGLFLKIYQALIRKLSPSLLLWIGWIGINTLGFYVHYFCLLSLNAQVLTFLFLGYRPSKGQLFSFPLTTLKVWGYLLVPYLLLFPWGQIFLDHFTSPKTSWLPSPHTILPVFNLLLSGLLMLIFFPLEGQPLPLKILMGGMMLVIGSWIGWQLWRGWKELTMNPHTRHGTLILSGLTMMILVQFLAIIYLFQKDLTIAPRYSFVYYPALCSLFGASLLASPVSRPWFSPSRIVPLLGFLSCICVVFNLTFQKPYAPQQVASQFNQSSGSILVAIAYRNSLHIPLGLSYALALYDLRTHSDSVSVVFFDHSEAGKKGLPGDRSLWNKLARVSVSPDNLWLVAPGLIRRAFTDQLTLGQNTQCLLDPDEYHRIGIPYQLYRCSS